MIRAQRSDVLAPESLSRPATRGKHKDKTEEQAIIDEYDAFLKAVPPPKQFEFNFKAYKNDDVKLALAQLFRGKCAYCESRYANTQPMDVEHFRPKGGVDEIDAATGKPVLAPGYPWLAARWTNLMPSCIDCNRARVQRDAVTGVEVNMGKANQFPITGPRMLPQAPTGPIPQVDDALIIDPTVEDPAEHLVFHEDGTVSSTTEKGRQSIRVYALNRAELAFERLGLARLIEQRLTTIEMLANVLSDTSLPKAVQLDLRDLIAHEIDSLLELTEPGRPYSAMARQLINDNSPVVVPKPSTTPPWSPDVAAMLQRLTDRDRTTHHVMVATRMAALGFLPHLPTAAAYVRWTIAGSVRSVTLYQETRGLVSDSKAQRDFAGKLLGAQVLAGTKIRFTYASAKLDGVLVAAIRFRDWADGRDPGAVS